MKELKNVQMMYSGGCQAPLMLLPVMQYIMDYVNLFFFFVPEDNHKINNKNDNPNKLIIAKESE